MTSTAYTGALAIAGSDLQTIGYSSLSATVPADEQISAFCTYLRL